MKKSTKLKKSLALLYRYAVAVTVVWILLLAGSLIWNINNLQQSIQNMAQKEVLSSFKKDMVFQRWIASRGGVYVPLDDKTPSNPYLKHPERDITTTSGKKLTLMNAAYVFHRMMEEYGHLTGVKSRLVSLKPVNPVNAPDEWERKTLKAFEQDTKEIFGFTDIQGEPYLRVLSPLVTKDFCLKCHAYQGYKVGEIRGAIGVSLPMATYLSVERNGIIVHVWTHGIIMLVGLLGIGFVVRNFQKSIPESIRAEEELRKHRDHLEELVKEGAAELQQEITERKQTGEALRKSEERFRTIADFAYNWETWTDPDGKYIYVSPSFERITGYSPGQLLKDHRFVETIIHPDDHKQVSEHAQHHFGENQALSLDFRIIHRNGDIRWISHTCQPVYDSAGAFQGRRSCNRDVTEQKKVEEQFRQSQKMEAIGTLAGGIAHDFNNILTIIIGNAGFALMKTGKDDSLREELEEIRDAGERGADLTRQLLAFSRKRIIQPKIGDLNHLLTGIEKMLGRLISEDVEVLMILDPALGQVEIDPGQVEQAIMNLMINAKDAMPLGGKLTIETANVDLDKNDFSERGVAERPGGYVMLAVSDTGCGMDKEIQEHIFEPFFTTKETGEGTGLGLSTVYGIVKQNNGFIRVDSEPGQGSSFKIYLPKAKRDVASEKKEQLPATELGGSETILMVEDDDRRLENQEMERQKDRG